MHISVRKIASTLTIYMLQRIEFLRILVTSKFVSIETCRVLVVEGSVVIYFKERRR